MKITSLLRDLPPPPLLTLSLSFSHRILGKSSIYLFNLMNDIIARPPRCEIASLPLHLQFISEDFAKQRPRRLSALDVNNLIRRSRAHSFVKGCNGEPKISKTGDARMALMTTQGRRREPRRIADSLDSRTFRNVVSLIYANGRSRADSFVNLAARRQSCAL